MTLRANRGSWLAWSSLQALERRVGTLGQPSCSTLPMATYSLESSPYSRFLSRNCKRSATDLVHPGADHTRQRHEPARGVEQHQAPGIHALQVQGERFLGEQVYGDAVAGEGVEHQELVAGRAQRASRASTRRASPMRTSLWAGREK